MFWIIFTSELLFLVLTAWKNTKNFLLTGETVIKSIDYKNSLRIFHDKLERALDREPEFVSRNSIHTILGLVELILDRIESGGLEYSTLISVLKTLDEDEFSSFTKKELFFFLKKIAQSLIYKPIKKNKQNSQNEENYEKLN